ncbi:MAG: hypothetical protein WBA42_01490 [Mesorhizobium sp.]
MTVIATEGMSRTERSSGSKGETPADGPYDAAFFAAKHGLTLKAAEIIIYANGPSRHMCDAGATAFLRAVALRRDRKLAHSID